MDYAARQRNLGLELAAQGLSALVVTHLPNIRYLCGFTGSAGVLACLRARTRVALAFFTDGRYTEQARGEVEDARVVIPKKNVLVAALEWLARQRAREVGFEGDHVSVSTLGVMRAAAGKRVKLIPAAGIIERLRLIKDRHELAQIRSAVTLGSQLFPFVAGVIRPDIAEAEVAAQLEYQARRMGAEGMSFETIVAGGKRSALPHGRATHAPLPRRGFVILDYGVILAGYCSDMTRTVHLGRASGRSRTMYDAVLEAQLAGIGAVKAGATAGEVDRAARRVLERAKLGRYFTHSTGHGVGLEIHEPPRLGKKQDHVLQAGMVVTIEPGVYIPGQGGVRIEDMVVVTESGCEVLTPTPKELLTLH